MPSKSDPPTAQGVHAEAKGGAAAPRHLGDEERRALRWLTLAAAAVIAWMVAPVAMGIFFGALVGFSLQPLYERLKPKLGASLASVTTVSLACVGLLVTFGGLGWMFVAKGSVLARSLLAAIAPDGRASGVIDKLSHVTARFGVGPEQLQERAKALAEAGTARAATIAEALLAASAGSMLALFFAALTMHVILRHWGVISRRVPEVLPLRPAYTVALFDEFRRVGRTTLLGTIVTGIAQGLFATVGYWIAGVPQPLFFGAATAVASLIPAVGTLLVWVPIGVVLILTGHMGRGVLELLWGAVLVVGASDYVIRPRLVGGEGELPGLVTFAAIFGGVEVFGIKGLIVGPVFMSLGIAVLRLYAAEMRERRARPMGRAS